MIGPDDDTKPSPKVERRLSERARQDWQPHPDLIRECAGTAEFYGADLGPMGEDVIRRVLSAAAAWHARRDAIEQAHARRREDHAHETNVILGLAEARQRAAAHFACVECGGASGRACRDCNGTGVVA